MKPATNETLSDLLTAIVVVGLVVAGMAQSIAGLI